MKLTILFIDTHMKLYNKCIQHFKNDDFLFYFFNNELSKTITQNIDLIITSEVFFNIASNIKNQNPNALIILLANKNCNDLNKYLSKTIFDIYNIHLDEKFLFQEIISASNIIKSNHSQSIINLIDNIKINDEYTKGHCSRVCDYSLEIGKKLNLDSSTMEDLKIASLLHDIGKNEIPESILHKASSLTDDEFEIIKKHTVFSEKILNNVGDLKKIVPYIKHHHERIDGTGYPSNLKGDEIPFISRIIAVSDTFDALTSNRPYRDGTSVENAIKILYSLKGTQLDENIVDLFIDTIKGHTI